MNDLHFVNNNNTLYPIIHVEVSNDKHYFKRDKQQEIVYLNIGKKMRETKKNLYSFF